LADGPLLLVFLFLFFESPGRNRWPRAIRRSARAIDVDGVHHRVPHEVEGKRASGGAAAAGQPPGRSVRESSGDALAGGFPDSALRSRVSGLVIRNLQTSNGLLFFYLDPCHLNRNGPGRPGPSTSTRLQRHHSPCSCWRFGLAAGPARVCRARCSCAGLGCPLLLRCGHCPTRRPTHASLFRIEVTHLLSFLKKKSKKDLENGNVGVCT